MSAQLPLHTMGDHVGTQESMFSHPPTPLSIFFPNVSYGCSSNPDSDTNSENAEEWTNSVSPTIFAYYSCDTRCVGGFSPGIKKAIHSAVDTSCASSNSILTPSTQRSVTSHRFEGSVPQDHHQLSMPVASPRLVYLCLWPTCCKSGFPRPTPHIRLIC